MIIIMGWISFIGIYTVDRLVKENVSVIAAGRKAKLANAVHKLGAEYIPFDITNVFALTKMKSAGFDEFFKSRRKDKQK